MKKSLFILAAALVAFASCQKEVENVDVENPEEEIVSAPGTFIASFEDMDTKAFFTYDAVNKTYAHFWELNDKIAVYPKDDVYDTYQCTDVDNGVFTLNKEASGTASNSYLYNYAVYPIDVVDNVADLDPSDYPVSIDADGKFLINALAEARLTAPYGYGNIMVARAEDNKLNFKNIVGWLKISIKGDVSVRSLNINTYGQDILGPVYVEFDSTGEPVLTKGTVDMVDYYNIDFINAGLSPVKLSLDKATDFYIPVLPGTLNGFHIFVYTVELGEVDFETTKSVTITRNKVTPMAVKTIAGPSATLKAGNQFNTDLKTLAAGTGSTVYYYKDNTTITSIVLDTHSTVNTGTVVSATGSEKPVYANFDSGTGVMTLSTEATTIYANADASYMFRLFKGLTSTPAVGLNTSNVTNMSNFFNACSGLTSIDLSVYNTSKVTNMSNMFSSCTGLTSLDLSPLNTTSVTNMENMLSNLSLSSLDVSSLNTAKVMDMSYMFSNCSNLSSLDLSTFNTAEVLNMAGMFYNCTSLGSLNTAGWNTSKVQSMSHMFYDCYALSSLDVSGFDTSAVQYMSSMFESCNNLTGLNMSGWDTSKVTSMDYMFNGCTALTSINVSGFDLSHVTNATRMFYNCNKIEGAIDLSGTTAPLLTNMSTMFTNCAKVTTIGLPSTSSALTNANGLFKGCSKLVTILNTDNFNGRPTSLAEFFKGCSELVTVQLGTGFNTTDCNSYVSLFSGCSKLRQVYFYGLVIKGSGSGLGGGTDFYAKFNNAFAGVTSGCKVHCVGYSSQLINQDPYNSFSDSHASYTEGTRPTFGNNTTHTTGNVAAGYVYFCTGHSDLIDALK